MTVLFIALVTTVLSSTAVQAKNDEVGARCDEIDSQQNCTLYGVSIIDLIANRERFKGKQVRVIGYLRLEFEGNAIYLSHEDLKHKIRKNGLWVNLEPDRMKKYSEYSDHYVLIEGTFNSNNFGHGGLWSGALEKITRIEPWK